MFCYFLVFGNSKRAFDMYNIGVYPIVCEHPKFWNMVVREEYKLKLERLKSRKPHT